MSGKRVYVSGPYTLGDVALNVRRATEVADILIKAGHFPYLPHLTHFWHIQHPGPYQQWMGLDLAWLKVSECIVRIPGESKGADIEVAKAAEWAIPLVTLESLLK